MKLDVQSLSVTLGETTILKDASFSIDCASDEVSIRNTVPLRVPS